MMDNRTEFDCGQTTCYPEKSRLDEQHHAMYVTKHASHDICNMLSSMHRCTYVLYFIMLTLLLLVKHGTSQDTTIPVIMEVSENAEVGSSIGNVGNSLSITGPYIIFNKNPQNTDEYIEINIANGDIEVKAMLDYETHSRFVISLLSSDQRIIEVTITVIDINDNSPHFSEDVLNVSIVETAPINTKYSISSVVDLDQGDNGIDHESLRIINGNTDDTFGLDPHPTGGEVYLDLVLLKPLDYEQQSAYELVIAVYDNGIPRRNATLNVKVTVQDTNDNQPIFNQSRYITRIPENSTVGTSVLQVNC